MVIDAEFTEYRAPRKRRKGGGLRWCGLPLLGLAAYAAFASGEHDARASLTPPDTPVKSRNVAGNACEAAIADVGQNDAQRRALMAIAMVETGANPTPNAIMFNGLTVGDAPHCARSAFGRSCRFKTREDAITAAGGMLEVGYRNIDVGCFQVNLQWHSHRFRGGDPFDPEANARAAKAILKECFEKTRNLRAAFGCYHSPNNPSKAAGYAAKAMHHFTSLTEKDIQL